MDKIYMIAGMITIWSLAFSAGLMLLVRMFMAIRKVVVYLCRPKQPNQDAILAHREHLNATVGRASTE